jgi:hypothetical protein
MRPWRYWHSSARVGSAQGASREGDFVAIGVGLAAFGGHGGEEFIDDVAGENGDGSGEFEVVGGVGMRFAEGLIEEDGAIAEVGQVGQFENYLRMSGGMDV